MTRPKQLNLPVRLYRVMGDGFGDYETQAATPAQARWRAFKAAFEAGYFREGFRAFLLHGFSAREIRRSVGSGHAFLTDFQEGTMNCRRCGKPESDRAHR